jgi:hypothetical protein
MAIKTKRQFKYDQAAQERYRQKILDAKLLERALDHANGLCDMSATQVSIALKCIDKLLPSLQSAQVEGSGIAPFAVLPAVIEDDKAWSAAFDPNTPDPKAKH